jgi:effector-binding domain-containing protein
LLIETQLFSYCYRLISFRYSPIFNCPAGIGATRFHLNTAGAAAATGQVRGKRIVVRSTNWDEEQAMVANVRVQIAQPRILAAVRRKVTIGHVGAAWRPALDQVWAFLRARPELREDGHNIFLYHHPPKRSDPMDVDFGVEVVSEFDLQGEVRPVTTPAGQVATVVHVGSYDRLGSAHEAIHAWAAANHRAFAGMSWEIYGDWNDDPDRLETTVMYLLR